MRWFANRYVASLDGGLELVIEFHRTFGWQWEVWLDDPCEPLAQGNAPTLAKAKAAAIKAAKESTK